MYCRAGHGSATSRGGDNGLDLVECAKRLKDEGIDASLSLDAIIALQGAGSDRAALELEAGPSSPSREKEDAPPTPRWRYTHTAWVLLALGFVSRFCFLNWPREVVFDEVHFGKFIGAYISGHYFFDIHPPFGKLLIALVAYFGGYRTTQAFEVIGEPYGQDVDVFWLRAAPASFGALLVPLAFLLSRELGCSDAAALLVASMVLLDGALLVESRLLLTDSVLFLLRTTPTPNPSPSPSPSPQPQPQPQPQPSPSPSP